MRRGRTYFEQSASFALPVYRRAALAVRKHRRRPNIKSGTPQRVAPTYVSLQTGLSNPDLSGLVGAQRVLTPPASPFRLAHAEEMYSRRRRSTALPTVGSPQCGGDEVFLSALQLP